MVKTRYRLMRAGEETAIFDLVSHVFRRNVAPFYSANGIKKFFELISPDWLRAHADRQAGFTIIAEQHGRAAGMLTLIEERHIALFFVDPDLQGRGLGTGLPSHAIDRLRRAKPEAELLSVNASPNSVGIYERMGFSAERPQVDEDGMLFTPMRRPL